MKKTFTQDEVINFINRRFAMLEFRSPLCFYDFEEGRELSTHQFKRRLAWHRVVHNLKDRTREVSAFRAWIGDCRRRSIARETELLKEMEHDTLR